MIKKRLYKMIGALGLSILLVVTSIGFAIAAPTPTTENTISISIRDTHESSSKMNIQYYSIAELNKLNYKELINYLVELDEHKLNPETKDEYGKIVDEFGEYKQDVYDFFNDEERLQALIDAICERSPQYTDTDTKGISTLMEVLKLGYFVGFYNEELDYLNNQEVKDRCLPAISAVQNNPYFSLGNNEQAFLIKNLGRLIDSTSCNSDIVNKCVPILKQYYDNKDIYIGNEDHKQKEFAVYNIMAGVKHAVDLFVFSKNKNLPDSDKIQPQDTEWYGNIDEFIDYIGKFGVMGDYNDQNASLINNGLWINGYLSKFHSDPSKCNKVLTEALKIYPRLSEPYLQSISSITEEFNGIDYYGNTIDKEAVKEELKEMLLPKKYSFDNGKFIVIAGDRVTKEKVKRLYWASQEVKAQFFRMYGRDEALEQGHADDVLTAIIYNSPKEYKMNLFINGIATNNGGIYIEKEGIFYTWERTPSESRYTLEELFRHEFTHYLQSRYVVPGYWGEGIYKNNRLTWFEEGGAELIAGSTRTSNILDRASMVTTNGSFAQDPSNRFSLRELLDSKSVTSELYAYGYAFRSYLYNENFEVFQNLSKLITSNDIEGFDSYLDKLRNDSDLNDQYQVYMQRLYDNKDNLTIPLIDDAYLDNHVDKNPEEIYSDITSIANLTDVEVKEYRSEFFNTFTLSGTYTGDYYQGKERDWKRMNEISNDFLKTLDTYPWSGYKTLTCYFTNYRTDSSNNMQFDVVFHGLLTKDLQNKPPVAKILGSFNGVTEKAIKFSSKGSKDLDGSITAYLWDFGDGTTSTEANPKHVYSSNGDYTVTLTVTDSDRETSSASINVSVTDYLISENEPNNSFENANGPIFDNSNVTGIMDSGDNKDRFYFDVLEDGEVTITVTSDTAAEMNWVLYSESDLDNYASWAIRSGSELKNTFNATPGRYYLNIYKHTDINCPYTVNVQGPIQGSVQNTIASLEELQDIVLEYKAEYTLPTTVKATMDNGNVQDVLVTWSDTVDTTQPGESNLTGDVEGTDLTVSLKVTVNDEIPQKEFENLSDLECTSAVTGWGSINKDKSVDGNSISIGGKIYEKGIGLHAAGELVYNLEGKYSRFTADIGVDDEVNNKGTVVFEIFGDGKSLYYSNLILGDSDTQTVDIDVTGVAELKIEVRDYGDGIDSDHASIGDPKLYLAK